MTASWWVGFAGPKASFKQLQELWPDLETRKEGETILLGGQRLRLAQATLREDRDRFTDFANALLVLSRSDAVPIKTHGPLYYEDESGFRHPFLLPESAIFSSVLHPITLSSTFSTSRQMPRPLSKRVSELRARCGYFLDAAVFLANAGDDLREIYKAVEAIEKAHGGWPAKNKNGAARQAALVQRAEFCRALNVEEDEWEALHRTMRPVRHAYAHDMKNKPTYTAVQVRAAVQHALKVWLHREVPL